VEFQLSFSTIGQNSNLAAQSQKLWAFFFFQNLGLKVRKVNVISNLNELTMVVKRINLVNA
jgi:hypothetical protein